MRNIKINLKTGDFISGLVIAFVFILLSFASFSFFESIEKIFYGIEMRFALPHDMAENRIAIVNIDEKSVRHLGPWPWPRHIITAMIKILKDNGAKLIGTDILYSENEQNQGLKEVRGLYRELREDGKGDAEVPWLMERLAEIENRLDNDRELSETVKDCGNVILPVLGEYGKFDNDLVLTEDSAILGNELLPVESQMVSKDLLPLHELKIPFPDLARSSRGLGHINLFPDNAMSGRMHPLILNYRGHIIPSMPLRLALDYTNMLAGMRVIKDRGIQTASGSIPVSKAEILIKFKGGRRSFPYYSFVDILNVKKVPAVFENKIVLLGYTGQGGVTVDTPVDPEMPMVEFIANVIYNLLGGRYLNRPAFMNVIEAVMILFLVMLAIFLMARTSFLNRFGIMIGFVFFVIIIGIISFIALDTWFKTVYLILSILTVFVAVLVKEIIISQRSIDLRSKESIETNRMLGLSFQSQGLLDLAYEKFRKCPMDDSMKDVIYNLGLDYERKRMINKAISVYEYIAAKDKDFRDLSERIPKLRNIIGALPVSVQGGRKEERIFVDDDLEVKPTVGRYEIIKELGQGAMGIVYQARDPNINRLLAIKTIRFSDEFEEERVKEIKQRFFKEAEIAGKLSHPSIVAIYDAGEDYDLTYLAMEYLVGADLRKYCEKGSLLPLRKVLHIVSETASALDYAHNQGVVHRDVKPANIMLLNNGKIKVTDFGIAKAMSSTQTKSGVVLGTPNYMSPEQINGQQINGRSDLFALGVVLFELLTGQLPFHGKNMTNLLYNITQSRHPSARSINPKIPKACEQIIDKALEKDPSRRFSRGADMAKYLRAMIKKIDQVAERA
ncbi:MAG: CHASE2 domain-containing protein [Deltaproteobacteria bacterium]|nr:CHASE2 domain-containing protein [Deltaproteobacteria bacterium]